MPTETIVAVYDTAAHADAAVRELEAANVPSSAISRHSGTSETAVPRQTESVHEKGFWASLFGGEPDHDASLYDRSVSSGSSVVAVKVPDEHVRSVTEILERHNPVDMDERAASYGLGAGSTTTTTTTTAGMAPTPAASVTPELRTTSGVAATRGAAAARSGEEVLALSEEQLTVGKRLVNRGTTRVRRFVVETPVEEAVTLHSERVTVERRPVAPGTPVSNADFTDRTIEATESEEEAVVAKTTQVKEEVVINKAATDRVETVRDTVRREDVEITRDGEKTTTTGTPAASETTTTTATPAASEKTTSTATPAAGVTPTSPKV